MSILKLHLTQIVLAIVKRLLHRKSFLLRVRNSTLVALAVLHQARISFNVQVCRKEQIPMQVLDRNKLDTNGKMDPLGLRLIMIQMQVILVSLNDQARKAASQQVQAVYGM